MKTHLAEDVATLQDDLNSLINPNWKTANQDWRAAMMLEGAEAYDSTAWKWWKSQNIDLPNIKVELVDIFHFLLSLTIEAEGVKGAANHLATLSVAVETNALNRPDYLYKIEDDLPRFRKDLKLFIAETVGGTYLALWQYWSTMWLAIGESFDTIAREYFVKNLLNIFRQENGYKEGTYHKMWVGADSKHYEDNVITYEIANTLSIEDDDFVDKLRAGMLEAYNRLAPSPEN